MRASFVAVVVVAVAAGAPLAAPEARADSGACTSDAQCTAPAVCRLSESLCVREAIDADSLRAAIAAANADAGRDVIVIGSANPDANEGQTRIQYDETDTGIVDDPVFGPLAFGVISTPITIEGNSVALSRLDANTDARMFVVQPDAAGLDVQPDLTLKNMTIIDARPGPAGAGAVFFGGGAVHVTNVATGGGLRSTFNADGVVFSSNGDPDAPADAVLFLAGGAATLLNCSFQDNLGTIAGAIVSSATSLTVTGGDFDGNNSAGAGAVSVSTDATFTNVTFAENHGALVGGIQATGGALRISGGIMRDNSSDNVGAVLTSTDTNVVGQAQFTGNTGGVAGIDLTSTTATLSIINATFDDNHGDLAGGVRSQGITSLRGCTFTNNSADDGQNGFGGAAQARSLSLENGTYRNNFAAAGGGAVAITNTPAGAPAQVLGARFDGNSTDGNGGGLLDTGAALTVNDCTFTLNEADGAGGGIYVQSLAAGNTVVVTGSSLNKNIARPTLSIVTADPGLDELGGDTGHIEYRVLGTGSALVVDGAGGVDVNNNCIMGNAATAVDVRGGGAVAANDNWWGDATGPGPASGGDSVGTGVTATTFLNDPTGTICESASVEQFPRPFITVTVTDPGDAAAEINADYRVVDLERGTTLLAAVSGSVVPDLRTGKLVFDFVGVNDAKDEGNELFTFSIPACTDDGCVVNVPDGNSVQFSITDNGDGVVAEGEGEGEDCDETLSVNPGSLLLPNTGDASSASLKVTNASACTVQLFAPLLKKGASQGFTVDALPPDKLVLDPGGAVNIVVRFTPKDEPSEEPPAGELQLETTRGTLEKIPLGLIDNCACSTSSAEDAPALGLALVGVAAGLVVVRRRRRT